MASAGTTGSAEEAPSPAAERAGASATSGVGCSTGCCVLAAVRRRVRAAGFSADRSAAEASLAAGASGATGAASSVNAAASRSAARRRARTTWASLICASARACATSSEMGADASAAAGRFARVVRVVRRLGFAASSPSAAGLATRRVRLGLAGTASSIAADVVGAAALGASGAEAGADTTAWSDVTGAAGAVCVVVISFSCC